MATTITHTQTRTDNVAPALTPYRVDDIVTAATLINPAVFVFKVSDSQFDHVATVVDMQEYPTGASFSAALAAASLALKPYFRWTQVTRDHSDVNLAIDFGQTLIDRMTTLAREYDIVATAFVGVTVGTLPPP